MPNALANRAFQNARAERGMSKARENRAIQNARGRPNARINSAMQNARANRAIQNARAMPNARTKRAQTHVQVRPCQRHVQIVLRFCFYKTISSYLKFVFVRLQKASLLPTSILKIAAYFVTNQGAHQLTFAKSRISHLDFQRLFRLKG